MVFYKLCKVRTSKIVKTVSVIFNNSSVILIVTSLPSISLFVVTLPLKLNVQFRNIGFKTDLCVRAVYTPFCDIPVDKKTHTQKVRKQNENMVWIQTSVDLYIILFLISKLFVIHCPI